MQTVAERFLRYVSFDTQSDEASETCPSTAKQKLLGAAIVEEMKAMGIDDAFMDENGEPLSGESVEIYGDSIDRAVYFRDGSDFSSYEGKTVRLRFRMFDAKLYSMIFTAE